MHGTNFVNFVGYNAWIGGEGSLEAVRVTEWDEPQAVVGSYLHKYAYPDWYQDHLDDGKVLMVEGVPEAIRFLESLHIECVTSPTRELAKAAGNMGCLTGVVARERKALTDIV